MKYLFIDESGDHNLQPEKIDPTFPLFVLTGIIFDRLDLLEFKPQWLKMKKDIFGSMKVVLHSEELTRPNKSKQKKIKDLTNKEKRKVFYDHVNKNLETNHWSLVAFVINKPEFAKLFPKYPPDPYFLSFSFLISAFAERLRKKESARVFVEQRNRILDRQFLLSWEQANLSRVGLVTSKELKEHRIERPIILTKSWKHTGLEVADIVSYRIARQFAGRQPKPPGNEVSLDVIKSKKFTVAGLPDVPNPFGKSK